MKIGKRLFLLLLLAVLLTGCAREVPAADERLGAILGDPASLPAGILYSSAVAPYEEGNALTEELIAALYKRADGTLEYTGRVEEAAVYLSSGIEGDYLEVAVFVCYGSADTEAVAAMCLRRAHLVARGTDLTPEDAVVLRSGRTLYFCLGSDEALCARIAARFAK